MNLPALIPPQYDYCKEVSTDKELFVLLVKDPSALIPFFEAACEDETWASSHQDFLQDTIAWLSDRFFEDKLDSELARHCLEVIRPHYQVLDSFFPLNLTIRLKDNTVPISAFLYGASSDFWHALIRSECRDKNKDTITFREVPYEIFRQADAYIKTGDCRDLWRQEEDVVLAAMNLANGWGLEGMMLICEEILERYITRDNVLDKLVMAQRKSWKFLRQKCIEFYNMQNTGVALVSKNSHLGMEFFELTENVLELFERLRNELTHLVFSQKLTQEERFGDILRKIPRLVSLDISRSSGFSDELKEIPSGLQELDLSQCLWVNNENLKKIIRICPHLQRLALNSNSQINYGGWGELKKLSRLESLDLAKCYQLTDDEFFIIVQACPQLLSLNISECIRLTDKSFERIARGMTRLTTLNLSRCSVTDIPLIAIAALCRNLAWLDLTRCVNLTDKGILEAVKNAAALRELNLEQCNVGEGVLEQIRKKTPPISLKR
jgi:hypothetical protein